MWPCYGVHIAVCMALLVCVHVLCQPVWSCIKPSLHGLDFFLEIFLQTYTLYSPNSIHVIVPRVVGVFQNIMVMTGYVFCGSLVVEALNMIDVSTSMYKSFV